MTSKKGKSSKGKFVIILMAFLVLATGCGNDDTVTPTPTPEVITGEVTADAIIEDTVEAIETGAEKLCSLCLLGEILPGGDDCNCNAICDAEVICKGE